MGKTEIPKYPYVDGDTIVIGPETFKDVNGRVISHQGENFVRQAKGPRPTPPVLLPERKAKRRAARAARRASR